MISADLRNQTFDSGFKGGETGCEGATGGKRVAVDRCGVGQSPVNVLSATVKKGAVIRSGVVSDRQDDIKGGAVGAGG